MNEPDEMRADYGELLKDGVRGKYFEQCQGGVTAILLEADVAEVFTDGKQVNQILRALIPTVTKRLS